MKGKYIALPLAAVLLLSGCAEDNEANELETEDALLEDSGSNDIGS